jgi:hypothetical protein
MDPDADLQLFERRIQNPNRCERGARSSADSDILSSALAVSPVGPYGAEFTRW